MQPGNVSIEKLTERIDYLQRIGNNPAPLPAGSPLTSAPLTLRRIVQIAGIGRSEKLLPPHPRQGQQSYDREQPVRLLSEDVLKGLYSYKIPLAFLVRGVPGRVAIHMGIWSPLNREKASIAMLDHREKILQALLRSLYPAIDLVPVQNVLLPPLQRSGLVLGIPTAQPPETLDHALPLDRLIRSLSASSWAFLVLAQPLGEQELSALRNAIIYETRDILAAYPTTGTKGNAHPLAQHYIELLKLALTTLTQGQTVGAWRTGVYLLGDITGYYQLASLWRGIFSGNGSGLEPVRVWDSTESIALANNWEMPDVIGMDGPGRYRHLHQYQTLLTSSQLAAYVHLPQLETSGFSITIVPGFDAVPPSPASNTTVTLGKVIPQHEALSARSSGVGWEDYRVSITELARHVFVAGVTGAGKTNTIFHLLKEVDALGIPFLVIEPAKAEYRALFNDPRLTNRLQVFTLGNENGSPFRLNPFEVVSWPGTPVSTHLDLLRSVFSASFGMWTPLPQVLEQCLHRIYEDRGWDIATNTNARLDNQSNLAAAFPTLSDLVAKVDEVTRQLGYEEKIAADIRAALSTRINALRAGGKGRMLDVQRSLPMKMLLDQPTILELEGIGDDDDKAFIMGLVLIRLVEYRQEEHRQHGGKGKDLQHVLVFEEAHRLLANIAQHGREEEANPRGKAVESFANLLSEIRAYGQGIIVADQVPVKLAPDVIKNTNLKIVHRVVSEDDRKVLAGAMVMNERQTEALARLKLGQAAIFSEGDDAPLLIQVDKTKGQSGQTLPGDTQIATYMAASSARRGLQMLLLPFPGCAQTCSPGRLACQEARQMVENAAFQAVFARIILSTIEDTDALDRMWGEMLSVVQAKRSPKSNLQELLRCLLVRASYWYASRRGIQAGWPYSEAEELADKLRQVLHAKLDRANPQPLRGQFRQYAHQLYARTYPPFSACKNICDQNPAVCLYRYAAADLIERGKHRAAWYTADTDDASSQDGRRRQTWSVCQDAAYDLIEWIDDVPISSKQKVGAAAGRTGLCFAQQMLAEDTRKAPGTTKKIIEKLLKEPK